MARAETSQVRSCQARAENGAPEALFDLGLLYSTGRGVPLDLVAAHKWFNLAALKGNLEARQARAELAAQMTAQQVAQAQRLAREWQATHRH